MPDSSLQSLYNLFFFTVQKVEDYGTPTHLPSLFGGMLSKKWNIKWLVYCFTMKCVGEVIS